VPDRSDVLTALAPVLEHLSGVDCRDPGASAALNERLPLGGTAMREVEALVRRGVSEGWLTPRGEPGVRFGRVAKPGAESRGFSIDAVHMDRPGPEHTHPNGEIDLCFALSGAPTFDGRPPGWVVLPPGSRHVPTVAGGEMAILYFLPGGAIEFHGLG
jgi:hypothetical protein